MEKIVLCLVDIVWSQSNVITSTEHVSMVVTADTKDQTVWKNVKIIILDQTVMKNVTTLAEVATKEQEYVTKGVIRDGKDYFVTKHANLGTMEWAVIRNVARFVKNQETVILFPDIVKMDAKVDGRDLTALRYQN